MQKHCKCLSCAVNCKNEAHTVSKRKNTEREQSVRDQGTVEIGFKHFKYDDWSRYSYCDFAPIEDEVAGPVCCDLHATDLLNMLEVADPFIDQIADNGCNDDGVRYRCKEDNSSSFCTFNHAKDWVSKRISSTANFKLKVRVSSCNFQNWFIHELRDEVGGILWSYVHMRNKFVLLLQLASLIDIVGRIEVWFLGALCLTKIKDTPRELFIRVTSVPLLRVVSDLKCFIGHWQILSK